MKILIFAAAAAFLLSSCNDSGKSTSFCDTVCKEQEISFNGTPEWGQTLTVKLKDCIGDSVVWTHARTITRRALNMNEFLDKKIKMNKSSISCSFQDTTMAWLTFNDCTNRRGYLLKLPYESNEGMQKITGALTSFDPKFSIDPDLRAFTDRGNLYVVNVKTGKQESMTFKKEFDIDFDKLHDAVDTVNVTKQRMFIVLKDKDGGNKTFEKNIQL